jgi:hypothetical protein
MKKTILPLLLIMGFFAKSQSTRAGSYLPVNVPGGQNVINSSVVWDSAYYLIDTVTNEVFVWGHASATPVTGGYVGTSIKFTPPFPMLTPPPYGREMARGQATIEQLSTQPYAGGKIRVNAGGQFLIYWNSAAASVNCGVYYSYTYVIQ